MTQVSTIYQDKTGRLWEVSQLKLPRPDGGRGVYRAWLIQSGTHSYKGRTKKEVLSWAAAVKPKEQHRL